MSAKSFIDSSRPMALYMAALGFTMLLSLLISSVPELSFSSYVDWPYRKYWSAAMFATGSALSALAFGLHARRAAMPWRISRAHVTLPFLAGAVLLLAAVVISR